MSLCMYARIAPMCITKEILDKVIGSYFLPGNSMSCEINMDGVFYEKISKRDNIAITFLKERRPPFNFYDSDIINGGFKYMQLIIFDIQKDTCSIDEYKSIIKFCVYLQKQNFCEILITSDAHDEICFLSNQGIIWSHQIDWRI